MTIYGKPRVSIVMLTHNRLNLAKECIPKMLTRIGPISNEVLIWDNCSIDGTYDWVVEYGRADCRIKKVFGSNRNIGVEAINNLAEEATGDYILKVDDDVEVPYNFASRVVQAYERAAEEKLLYLAWDMEWEDRTFATRSGMHMYKENSGKIIELDNEETILCCFHPSRWLVNGICRLSPRDKFLEVGGHPRGIIYGADYHVSKAAEEHGYWVGFLAAKDLVKHLGGEDSEEYRKAKNAELKKHGSPLHV